MRKILLPLFWVLLEIWPQCSFAVRETPFINASVEPTEYHHWEFYLLGIGDKVSDGSFFEAPYVELDYGIFPNMEVHAAAALVHNVPSKAFTESTGATRTTGLGDIEIGFLYRFLEETDTRPQMGTYPNLELPTGSAKRNLGNGRFSGSIPLLFQKSWGQWTLYGGPWYTFNNAPEMKNYWSGGFVLQRILNERFLLGLELFASEKEEASSRSYTLLNIGAGYNITPRFAVVCSLG